MHLSIGGRCRTAADFGSDDVGGLDVAGDDEAPGMTRRPRPHPHQPEPQQPAPERPKPGRRQIGWSRKASVWLVGGLAVLAVAGSVGLVASSANSPHPTAAANVSSNKNALNAILLKHPDAGTPISELITRKNLPAPTYQGDNGRIGVPASAKPPTVVTPGYLMRFNPGAVNGAFNLMQLAALAMKAGCPAKAAPIAAAIAAAESGGNPGAQGDIALMDSTWDWSAGLWQIRGLRAERGTGELRDSLANANPMKNALAMVMISNRCTNWTPWSTYNTGAYLPYLGMSKTAALAAVQYHTETGAYPPMGPWQPATVPQSAPRSTSSRHAHSSSPRRSSQRTGTHSGKRSGTKRSGSGGSVSQPGSTGGSAGSAPAPAPTSAAPTLPKPTLPKLPKPTLPKLSTPTLPKLPTSSLPKLPKPTLPKLPVSTSSPKLP